MARNVLPSHRRRWSWSNQALGLVRNICGARDMRRNVVVCARVLHSYFVNRSIYIVLPRLNLRNKSGDRVARLNIEATNTAEVVCTVAW